MRPTPMTAILALTLAAATPVMAASLKDVAPYPEADKGFTRQVIHLPAQADESAYKLEILAGKTLQVDCNRDCSQPARSCRRGFPVCRPIHRPVPAGG